MDQRRNDERIQIGKMSSPQIYGKHPITQITAPLHDRFGGSHGAFSPSSPFSPFSLAKQTKAGEDGETGEKGRNSAMNRKWPHQ